MKRRLIKRVSREEECIKCIRNQGPTGFYDACSKDEMKFVKRKKSK